MEDRYTYSRQGSGLWRSLRDGDFEEEDIWAILKESNDSTMRIGQSIESSVTVRRHLPSAARMIPRTFSAVNHSSSNSIGSSSSSSSHKANGVKQQQSAPVNIPNWSKISKNQSKKGSWHHDDGDYDDDHDGGGVLDGNDDDDDDEGGGGVLDGNDDEGGGGGGDGDWEYNSKLPPHEILAKRLARSQISSFSVFEGIGRKLKGRDLRKVRNAVLTKTGFLE